MARTLRRQDGRCAARMPIRALLLLCVAAGLTGGFSLRLAAAPPADPDYDALYSRGLTFAKFLETARANRDEWRERYSEAAVTADIVTRMRALPSRRLILAVAEDWCADSVRTIPYVARIVDAAPGRLAMRIVNATVGRPALDANLTPDGRAATPTVVVLTEHKDLVGSWVERPSTAQAWFLEQQKSVMQQPLHEQLMTWYENDAGRTTVAEVAALLER